MSRSVWFCILLAACASPGGQAPQPDIRVDETAMCSLAVVAMRVDEPGRDALATAAGIEGATLVAAQTEPVLQNQDDVSRALIRSYPARLRNAGVGGISTYAVMLDRSGRVMRRTLMESSGQTELDEASAVVIDLMRFSPALADGCRAQFLTALPIRFQVVRQ